MDAGWSTQSSISAKGKPTPAADRPVVVGTGLIALDVIISADPSRKPVLAAGGTCANVLTALSYLGWRAYPVARLNGDAASVLVWKDLRRWDVELEFAALKPTAATPIIAQIIRRDRRGSPVHRFSLSCPACGTWFPSFRAVRREGAREVTDAVAGWKPSEVPRVFFFDRVSRGALLLAETLAARNALVVFEPSGVGDPKLFAEALAVAHVLKFSRDRLPDLASCRPAGPQCLLEIETSGAAGLRYRSRLLPSFAWHSLEAVQAPQVVDTAGAGDWCTAGLLSCVASSGLSGLADTRPGDLKEGIRFGQAAAALACGYEGARAMMDTLSHGVFERRVSMLLSGKTLTDELLVAPLAGIPVSEGRDIRYSGRYSPISGVCPACG